MLIWGVFEPNIFQGNCIYRYRWSGCLYYFRCCFDFMGMLSTDPADLILCKTTKYSLPSHDFWLYLVSIPNSRNVRSNTWFMVLAEALFIYFSRVDYWSLEILYALFRDSGCCYIVSIKLLLLTKNENVNQQITAGMYISF